MRRFFRLIYRLLVALAAIALGAFGIVDGLSGTSAMDIGIAACGGVVAGVAYWFGKRFVSDDAPSAWMLLALVWLFGFAFSLVENTSLAFVLFGVFMIFGGVAFVLLAYAPHVLGVNPKTYVYGSNIFFDAVLPAPENTDRPPLPSRRAP